MSCVYNEKMVDMVVQSATVDNVGQSSKAILVAGGAGGSEGKKIVVGCVSRYS